MRAILAFVVLLAAAKFGYQEWVYRTALVDTLINTYRQDAVERCQKESKDRNLEVGYSAWSDPESFQQALPAFHSVVASYEDLTKPPTIEREPRNDSFPRI